MSHIGSVNVQPDGRPWWETLTDSSIVAMFAFASFPETLIGKMYIGPLPAIFLIFYIVILGSILEWLLARDRTSSKKVACALAVALLMTANGLVRGAELKWLVIDLSAFSGLIAGLSWANRRSLASIQQTVYSIAAVTLILLTFTVVGLKLGFVPASRVSGRLYVKSLFLATFFLCVLVPVLWGAFRSTEYRLPTWIPLFSVLSVTGVLLISSAVTGTRSIGIAAIIGFGLSLRNIGGDYRGLICSALTIVGVCLAVLVAEGFFGAPENWTVARRFAFTVLSEEPRWIEIQMLWDQLTTADLVTGLGFGSRFHSPVVIEGSDLAIVPHVAIFAFLQKGGVALFLGYVLAPFFRYLYLHLSRRASPFQRGCWGSILTLLIFATMSGGWDFHRLFLYGALVTMAARSGHIEPSPRKPVTV